MNVNGSYDMMSGGAADEIAKRVVLLMMMRAVLI